MDNTEIQSIGSKKMIKGIVAILVVVIVAFGTFFVSRKVNSTTPIAPNAPASQPKAFDIVKDVTPTEIIIPAITKFDPNGTIDCSKVPNTLPYGNRCVPIIKSANGDVNWAPGAIEALTKK